MTTFGFFFSQKLRLEAAYYSDVISFSERSIRHLAPEGKVVTGSESYAEVYTQTLAT